MSALGHNIRQKDYVLLLQSQEFRHFTARENGAICARKGWWGQHRTELFCNLCDLCAISVLLRQA